MAIMVAALFVQENGCYFGMDDVDPWPEGRDARLYDGPNPVVAHPPCQLWGSLARLTYATHGGEHNRPGNDGGCFASALESVNRWGGVLEHPARTMAWASYGLEKPVGLGWMRSGSGWVCEVWQSAYGHRARKATWLYYHGVTEPFQLRLDRNEGTHQVGSCNKRRKNSSGEWVKKETKPSLSKREANATPIEFRDELLRLARWAV